MYRNIRRTNLVWPFFLRFSDYDAEIEVPQDVFWQSITAEVKTPPEYENSMGAAKPRCPDLVWCPEQFCWQCCQMWCSKLISCAKFPSQTSQEIQ
ncbi:hypothetical protein WA026_008253 [Henosepilachna vigintioctopunctata]|uniref:Uncharacterized protein n=1 Tax=Henosepilachna vigintioctopunctata TaxID=420089 RepID=A0AAW1TQR0_9CUCU